MPKLLLLMNGSFFAFTSYSITTSWSALELIPLALFGSSLILLTLRDSRTGNLTLLITNGALAALGILLVLVATVGGLFTYGLGAIASLALLVPIAVIFANAAYGKKMLASATS